jgi:hypothetical protein
MNPFRPKNIGEGKNQFHSKKNNKLIHRTVMGQQLKGTERQKVTLLN